MANPHRGHVDLEAGSEVYRLVFNTNAICELEDRLDKPAQAIFAGLAPDENGKPREIRFGVIRDLLWAALREYHEDVTPKGAARIIDECGPADVLNAIQEALTLAYPEPEESASDRPTKRRKAGTG